jgi:uncharacterized glyoxalase superfamily protein PhnB
MTYDPDRGYPVVVPCVLYDDPVAAAAWLTAVLGFREAVRATLPSGWVGHIEIERAGFRILLGRRGGQTSDTASVTQVFVDDVGTASAAALEAGGSIIEAAVDRPWGVRQAVVADPEGQRWVLCRYLGESDPAAWYGRISPDAG